MTWLKVVVIAIAGVVVVLIGNTNRGVTVVLSGVPWVGAAAQDIWTALVLLAAVTVDTLARRGRTAQ